MCWRFDALNKLIYLVQRYVDINGLSVDIPGILVDIPGILVDIPGISVDIPGISVDIPGISVDMPGISDSVVVSTLRNVEVLVRRLSLDGR